MWYEAQDHLKYDIFLSMQTFLEWFFSIPASQVLSVRTSRQKGFIISKKLLLKPISVTAYGILLTQRRKPSFSFQGNALQGESSSGIRHTFWWESVKFVRGKKYLNLKTLEWIMLFELGSRIENTFQMSLTFPHCSKLKRLPGRLISKICTTDKSAHLKIDRFKLLVILGIFDGVYVNLFYTRLRHFTKTLVKAVTTSIGSAFQMYVGDIILQIVLVY